MAASSSDKFRLVAPNAGWQLDASGISDAIVTSFGLVSATALPTGTGVTLTVDRVDGSGTKTPAKMERIKGVVSGTNVVSCVRGVGGTAQAHAGGAVVEIVIDSTLHNDMVNGILVEHNQDGTHAGGAVATPAHAATSKATPVDADELPIVDSAASNVLKKLTWANVKATLKTYFDTLYSPLSTGGWTSYSAVVPTRSSADDPTYVLQFAGVDLTSTLSVGMKVKFTQNSATVYGIITAVSFSTNTLVTLYCGTDYDVLDTATYAISSFNYSMTGVPIGFPMDPTKWQVIVTDASIRTQSNPTASTWYNIGGANHQISVPIGAWDLSYKATGEGDALASGVVVVTLSTANNSESDPDFSVSKEEIISSGSQRNSCPAFVQKPVVLGSKTIFYLNVKSSQSYTGGLWVRGDNSRTVLRAVCTYL